MIDQPIQPKCHPIHPTRKINKNKLIAQKNKENQLHLLPRPLI